MVNQRALVKFSTPEFDRVKKVYYVVVTLPPEGVFTRKSEIIVSDRSQYRPLIDKEEAFHKRQWEGKVSRDQGGCGDLFTNNAIEHYMEGAAANYDGKARFEGPDPNTARLNAALGYERARSRAQRESERLRDDRTGYIERKAKEEAGFREAYTYEFTYESLYGTNPTNSLPPWRYDGQ
jgi:hypothetical protein